MMIIIRERGRKMATRKEIIERNLRFFTQEDPIGKIVYESLKNL